MMPSLSPTLSRNQRLQVQQNARAEYYRRMQKRPKQRPLREYQYDAVGYIEDKLGWTPWGGTAEQPGQVQIIETYELALRQLHERDAWEKGELTADQLQYWQPGQVIKNWIRVPAGHTVGKTKIASGLVNHFFDSFPPAIIYTFAPTWEQIHDLLWKEIKTDRRGKGLPGRILDMELKVDDNHFAKGRATNNSGGSGTERVQGQHGRYLMFVLDEAEGIPAFVWNAVNSMSSGGIVIVLMLANPRTRSSRFHKERESDNVASFQLSCLWHPNVLEGKDIVPGGVRRDWVDKMIDNECEVVTQHNPDKYTFEVPWRPGIFEPSPEFMFRVLGIAPSASSDRSFVPYGRYQTAVQSEEKETESDFASMGIDAARFGTDYGTLYIRHGANAWRAGKFYQARKDVYVGAVKQEAVRLAEAGVTRLHIRVDGTGGFGAGVVDDLLADQDMRDLFEDYQVVEVHFGESSSGNAMLGGEYQLADGYDNIITEMYAHAGEIMKGLTILKSPPELEDDLCDRLYGPVNREGRTLFKLEDKENFRKRHGRSPDDGDGFVLAVAPEFLFGSWGMW